MIEMEKLLPFTFINGQQTALRESGSWRDTGKIEQLAPLIRCIPAAVMMLIAHQR